MLVRNLVTQQSWRKLALARKFCVARRQIFYRCGANSFGHDEVVIGTGLEGLVRSLRSMGLDTHYDSDCAVER